MLAMAIASERPSLPERLGFFVRGEVEHVELGSTDRELYREYGLKSAFRASYTDPQRRRMAVEAFRFSDAEGAHAAYLYSRPARGVSPMIWEIPAVTSGGVTVLEYRNYLLRFQGAVPSISTAMGEMLGTLPE